MTDLATAVEPATTLASQDLEAQLEGYRRELTGYCYRMLGATSEAEDATQEVLLRAWRSHDGFEGRSSLRTWLYRIATNVCIDMAKSRQRRARPMDMGPSGKAPSDPGPVRTEATWIEPVPDGRVLGSDNDPAELAVQRETIRLAFVAALQHLPPRQRAVLILREVLRWHAVEVAQLLDTTVPSVNSALQRARATMASSHLEDTDTFAPLDAEQQELLARYVEAFERYDVDLLVALLHDDAVLSMPPYQLWLQGPDEIMGWFFGPGIECKGSRLVATVANGSPAFGQYRPSGPGGRHEPWALQVVELSGGRIVGFNAFLDTQRWFPLFGLPAHPDD